MRYREVLAVLESIKEKNPDVLEQVADVVIGIDGSIEVDLALTMGAEQKLYFVPTLEKNNGG